MLSLMNLNFNLLARFSSCCETFHMRKKVFVAIACLGLIGVLVWTVFLGEEKEPQYQGRSLSEWLDNWQKFAAAAGTNAPVIAPSHEAVIAIRVIGTNAFPTIFKWISYEPSPLHRRMLSAAADLPLP